MMQNFRKIKRAAVAAVAVVAMAVLASPSPATADASKCIGSAGPLCERMENCINVGAASVCVINYYYQFWDVAD